MWVCIHIPVRECFYSNKSWIAWKPWLLLNKAILRTINLCLNNCCAFSVTTETLKWGKEWPQGRGGRGTWVSESLDKEVPGWSGMSKSQNGKEVIIMGREWWWLWWWWGLNASRSLYCRYSLWRPVLWSDTRHNVLHVHGFFELDRHSIAHFLLWGMTILSGWWLSGQT